MKELSDGSKVVILFNKKDVHSELSFRLEKIGYEGKVFSRDLWKHINKEITSGSFSEIVAPHGVVMLKVSDREIED